MFKVVPDQLKVSSGWVRCGQCAEIFDAQMHWQSNADVLVQQFPITATPPGVPTPDQISDTPATYFTAHDLLGDRETDKVTVLESVSISSTTPEPIYIVEPESVEHKNACADDPDPDVSPSRVTEVVFEDVSFVRNARRQAFWRNPMLRAILTLVALILAGLFAVQLAVHQRSAILAVEPGLDPWLQLICRAFTCDVGLSKRIDAIVIDSSSFNKINEVGVFRLSFTLKNTASIDVAMPSLEISLTDTQEQVIIRRVLVPAQFGAFNGLVAANSDFSNALMLQMHLDAPLQRIAGYRLLAFYP